MTCLALALSLLIAPWAPPGPAGPPPDDEGWRALFDGGPLDESRWTQIGGGRFVLEDGVLRTECSDEGLGLLLYHHEPLGDCQIRVVYRTDDARDNSGVFVRIAEDPEGKLRAEPDADAEQGPWFAVHHGFEIQICDAADPLHRTGAVYSMSASDAVPSAPPDAWKTMIITLDGERIRVEVDGVLLNDFDPSRDEVPPRTQWYEPKREPTRPRAGYIGLQTHDPGDVAYFKEVSVRPLARPE